MDEFIKDIVSEHFGSNHYEIGNRCIRNDKVIEITDGQYWGTYGISNFWYWKEVLPDGSLSAETFHGYGE